MMQLVSGKALRATVTQVTFPVPNMAWSHLRINSGFICGTYCSVVALAIVGMSLLLSMITRCGVVLRECCIVVKV